MSFLKQKLSQLGKRKCFNKNKIGAEKFNLTPWKSELLQPISATANNNTFWTKVHIPLGESCIFQSLENANVRHVTKEFLKNQKT